MYLSKEFSDYFLRFNIRYLRSALHLLIEGPTSVKIGKYFYVYADKYHENLMAAVRSEDLIHWEDYTSHIKFPPHAKHGTVFKVTPDIVKMLSNAGL